MKYVNLKIYFKYFRWTMLGKITHTSLVECIMDLLSMYSDETNRHILIRLFKVAKYK